MSTLTGYNGLQVVTPDPTGAGGLAINNNFKALANDIKALSTQVANVDPTNGNDGTQGFVIGSRWYNTTTTNEFICLSNATGAAVWQAMILDAALVSESGDVITADYNILTL